MKVLDVHPRQFAWTYLEPKNMSHQIEEQFLANITDERGMGFIPGWYSKAKVAKYNSPETGFSLPGFSTEHRGQIGDGQHLCRPYIPCCVEHVNQQLPSVTYNEFCSEVRKCNYRFRAVTLESCI